MPIQWTQHMPQALQQHGAGRKFHTEMSETIAVETKFQASLPNPAEDAASPLTTPVAPPSSP
jgi:hypothetical protein